MANPEIEKSTVRIDGDPEPRVGDQGVTGNCRPAALVSRNGAIAQLCLPHLTGSGVSAAILDRRRGGGIALRSVDGAARIERGCLDETHVLRTRFPSAEGEAGPSACLPIRTGRDAGREPQPEWIISGPAA